MCGHAVREISIDSAEGRQLATAALTKAEVFVLAGLAANSGQKQRSPRPVGHLGCKGRPGLYDLDHVEAWLQARETGTVQDFDPTAPYRIVGDVAEFEDGTRGPRPAPSASAAPVVPSGPAAPSAPSDWRDTRPTLEAVEPTIEAERCRRLWQAVLAQAIDDGDGGWLQVRNRSFRLTCDMAGLDPQAVHEGLADRGYDQATAA